jgi:hypothetical protein
MDVSPLSARIRILPSTGLKTGSKPGSCSQSTWGVVDVAVDSVVGVCLHQHPILPPAFPPIGAEGGDVLGRTLHPVLEVVAAEARRLLVHWAQHVEPPEQMH